MGYHCDFCGEQKSIVYCRSDAASLCLSCDRNVHSANALSRRHSRTLVCENCNSQPAFVRCMEERRSLCQNCDWTGHASLSTRPTHRREPVNCYSGCPSAAEMSEIWSFLLDFPSVGDSICEQGMGSMSITDNRPTDCQGSQGKHDVQNVSILVDRCTVWMESVAPLHDSNLHNVDQLAGSSCSNTPKVLLPAFKGLAVCEDDGFYEDFDMDVVDLNIETNEEFFGVDHYIMDQLFDDGKYGMKDISGSNCPGAHDAEAHSSVSFSGLTGESNVGEFQDYGASSIPIVGEPPWPPPGPENSMSSGRSNAVMRYKEKKKARKGESSSLAEDGEISSLLNLPLLRVHNHGEKAIDYRFEKKVRYESRKARADVRRRVKGRFVKAGDAYDYDPLSQSRNC